jgi:hypothetical protein
MMHLSQSIGAFATIFFRLILCGDGSVCGERRLQCGLGLCGGIDLESAAAVHCGVLLPGELDVPVEHSVSGWELLSSGRERADTVHGRLVLEMWKHYAESTYLSDIMLACDG